MMALRYEETAPIARQAAESAIASEDSTSAARALIRVGLWEPERQWAERFCVGGLRDQRGEVRRAALIALGHLARRHHALQLDLVLPAVQRLLRDHPDLAGSADDMLDDIRMYIPGAENSHF